ncbi:uncharacterized protein LOC111294399 [Durio zibethinus]|uniref:Uncharacterized protein LOC111294399 n=1 Tax=Durio zibethinus TaxID=66656 RepID=A0A6P5YT19_DURZI|nr:uncharacterized protein LOC111294399 [Durio zibethinus]
MWQLLLGAAVAGSTGLLAKHLFNLNPNNPISQDTTNSNLDQEKQDLHLQNGFLEPRSESNWEEKQKQDGIFRFSSPESNGKTGVKAKDRNLRTKVVSKKAEKRSSGGGVEVNRRKFAVCLKKRRTAKNVAYKCGSCPSKDSSVFRRGLGFGLMYMMSAGKAEINKLNSAMEETTKVVQELKTELCKRKSSCNLQASNSANEVATSSKKFSGKNMQLLIDKYRDHNEIKVCSLPVIDDGEYACSILTEEPEPEPELVEMDQLGAELESELQKLTETEVSAKSLHESVGQRFDSYQCQGVLPSELDQKLCHLLIEQQENQIEELESELNLAQSKLGEKEAELQALKDCVRRLTNFSLSTVSDDDTEFQEKQGCMNDQDCHSGSETRKSFVGMKRPIES